MEIIWDNTLTRIPKGMIKKLSRFYLMRRSYSLIQNTIQNFNKNSDRKKHLSKKSLFDGFCVKSAVEEMRQKSIKFGLQLPSEKINDIYDCAVNNFCFEPEHPEKFKIGEIHNSYLDNKRHHKRRVFRALVSDLDNCQAIQEIIKDPILLEIACRYLGYFPTLITPHLTWSIASDCPLEEIKKNYPPTTFHYDIAGYNFVTAYFYITDVDVASGPHVMIGNSHRNKPFSLFLSGRHSDEKIYHHYGHENEIVIVGKAGFGFFQDPSCIHKVIPPIAQNRLLLQIRYS